MSKRIEMDDIRTQPSAGSPELVSNELLNSNLELASKALLSRVDGIESVQIIVIDTEGRRLTHTKTRPGSMLSLGDPAAIDPNPELMPKTDVGSEPSVGND